MRILLTGAKGLLGQALVQVLGPTHELIPSGHADLDVTDFEATRSAVSRVAPDLVIHSAAWTDVDGCERDPDRAFRVNVLGSRNVAIACREAGAACCYLSTDYVFDGAKPGAYTEFDSAGALNHYGASKLAGERVIQAALDSHWIVRSSWLFGPGGRNFVNTILTRARRGESLAVVDDQVGSPTYTFDLARGIDRLIQEPRYGIWHLTNSESCSWYRFACSVLSGAKLDPRRVSPIDSSTLDRPARRPRNSVLRNYCWELEEWPLLRPWAEALREYLSHPELA